MVGRGLSINQKSRNRQTDLIVRLALVVLCEVAITIGLNQHRLLGRAALPELINRRFRIGINRITKTTDSTSIQATVSKHA